MYKMIVMQSVGKKSFIRSRGYMLTISLYKNFKF